MMHLRNRLWSLWDMLKINANSFYIAATILESIKTEGLNKEPNEQRSALSDQDKEMILGNLEDLDKELVILSARLTSVAVKRLISKLKNGDTTYDAFSTAYNDIDWRLMDELSETDLFVLDASRRHYYEPSEPLFGQEVDSRFPSAIDDIIDAGRCIALASGTASVFHSMRVMEVGLKALGYSLGIPYAPSWESYITQIETKIAAKHRTKGIRWKKDESTYRDMAGDLTAIKIAWRNPTMHIVKRYSSNEAEEIFRAVRTFMKRLASRLDEGGKRVE